MDESELIVPLRIERGTLLLKISRKKVKYRMFSLNSTTGLLYIDLKRMKLSVDSIREVRKASDARNYREHFKYTLEDECCWQTIVYENLGRIKTLHILADSIELANEWYQALNSLKNFRKSIWNLKVSVTPDMSSLLKIWDHNGCKQRALFLDCLRICRQLAIASHPFYIGTVFDYFDETGTKTLDFKSFEKAFSFLKIPQEAQKLFRKLCKNNYMSFTEFKNFAINEQGWNDNTRDIEFLKSIYSQFAVKSNNKAPYMDLIGFSQFLSSKLNSVTKTESIDLSKPLTQYFCSSSHNTYLLAGQLKGESSIEGYIEALQQGCRCIELDVWDGISEPIITHGRTLVKPILLLDVVKIISKYAFLVTSMPLIISVECHCNHIQQTRMYDIFVECFEQNLLKEPIEGYENRIPPLSALQNRILMKFRVRDHVGVKDLDAGSSDSFFSEYATTEDGDINSESGSTESLGLEKEKPHSGILGKLRKVSVIQQLLGIAVYFRGINFRNFGLPEAKQFNHILSISEKSYKHIKSKLFQQLLKHNSRYFMRVYPVAYRINSGNFDPIICWYTGVQFVALNWQTRDMFMQINQALFAGTNLNGFVLKPSLEDFSNMGKFSIRIEVISGQNLFLNDKTDTTRPFVMIDILQQKTTCNWMTHSATNNSLNPVWNEVFAREIPYTNPILNFIRFRLYCSDQLFATFISRLDLLNSGYRYLPLQRTKESEKVVNPNIFVYIQQKDIRY